MILGAFQDNIRASPYLSDFDENWCIGSSGALNRTVPVLAQSELQYLSYYLGYFHKVAPQHYILRAIAPPLINFFRLKVVVFGLNIAYKI